jgi:hypothetical protein
VAGQRAALEGLGRLGLLGVPLYGLVTLIALVPSATRTALGLEPLQAEGFMLMLVLLLGIVLAWLLFMAPPLTGEPAAERDR